MKWGLALLLVLAAACGDTRDRTSESGPENYTGSFTVLESPEHGPQLCAVVATSHPPQCSGLVVVGWDWNAVENEQSANAITWGSWQVTGTYDGERFTLTAPAGAPEPVAGDNVDIDFSPACNKPDVIDATVGGAEWEAMSQDFGPFEIPDLVAAWVSDPAGPWDGPFVGSVIVLPGARLAAVDQIRAHYAGPLCVVERDAPTPAELARVQRELADGASRQALGEIQVTSVVERRGVVVADVWVADQEALDYARDHWGGLVELRGLLHPVQ